jgi:acyl-CoA thioester hydrolase
MTTRPVDIELRVRYAETDQMGVVHHSVHLVWFEMGRTEYCRAAGFSYAEMEKSTRTYMVVAEVRCRYRSPAAYDDRIQVRTWVAAVSPRVIRFEYEIRHLDSGRLIATGETVHVPVNAQSRPVPLPPAYLTQLLDFAGDSVGTGG